MRHNSNRRQFAYRQPVTAQRAAARPKSSSPMHLVILGALLLVGSQVVLSQLANGQQSFIQTNGQVLAVSDSMPIRPAPKINKQRLDKTMAELLAGQSGLNVSVSYKDLTTGRTFHYGTSNSFVAASVTKLLTASLYLKQVDDGKRSLNDNVAGANAKELLRRLIVVSDNAAWVALDKSLGAGNLESFARENGLKQYKHSNNTLSSDDVLTLLQKIYRGDMLSKSSRDLLLSYMSLANYRQYIVAALASDVTVYHKIGFLEDRVHDAAIVDNGRFPYLLVIFTEAKNSTLNFISTTDLIHDITESVNAPYDRS